MDDVCSSQGAGRPTVHSRPFPVDPVLEGDRPIIFFAVTLPAAKNRSRVAISSGVGFENGAVNAIVLSSRRHCSQRGQPRHGAQNPQDRSSERKCRAEHWKAAG
jgi:hypothetical protein